MSFFLKRVKLKLNLCKTSKLIYSPEIRNLYEMSLTWQNHSLGEGYAAAKEKWAKKSLYALWYHIYAMNRSQTIVFIIKHFYLCPTIIYPFPIAKYNSYLQLKKFCFKIAECKICNIEEKQQDTSLQVRLLMEEISVLELLSFYYR